MNITTSRSAPADASLDSSVDSSFVGAGLSSARPFRFAQGIRQEVIQPRAREVRTGGKMRTSANVAALFLTLQLAGAVRAPAAQGAQSEQPMRMPPSQDPAQHHHGDIKPVEAQYPQMGRAQARAEGALVTLEQV